jgi:hypothetical protein
MSIRKVPLIAIISIPNDTRDKGRMVIFGCAESQIGIGGRELVTDTNLSNFRRTHKRETKRQQNKTQMH